MKRGKKAAASLSTNTAVSYHHYRDMATHHDHNKCRRHYRQASSAVKAMMRIHLKMPPPCS